MAHDPKVQKMHKEYLAKLLAYKAKQPRTYKQAPQLMELIQTIQQVNRMLGGSTLASEAQIAAKVEKVRPSANHFQVLKPKNGDKLVLKIDNTGAPVNPFGNVPPMKLPKTKAATKTKAKANKGAPSADHFAPVEKPSTDVPVKKKRAKAKKQEKILADNQGSDDLLTKVSESKEESDD